MYMHILFDRQAYPEPQHLHVQKNKYGLAQQYGSFDLESAMMSGTLTKMPHYLAGRERRME